MKYEIRDYDMNSMLYAIERVMEEVDDPDRNYVKLAGSAVGSLKFISEILNAAVPAAAE